MVPELLHWERERARHVAEKFSEIAAREIEIGDTGVRLRGRADRIDRLADGTAEILDFKSGSNPSRRQAQTLVSPQLALEAALLRRGAFAELGAAEPADLVYVRLKANGLVVPESILKDGRKMLSAVDLAEDAWRRLEELVRHYQNPEAGYISRSLPFKEGDFDGDYDHLARVLEWSAGPGEADEP
jgi:ATP-dependent helicase/nuclease subunit B